MTTEILALHHENGKSVTVKNWGGDKGIITFWKNDNLPLLSLILTRGEANKLRDMLDRKTQDW